MKDLKTVKEAYVKVQVKNLLKAYDCYWFMPVQNGYGAASLDFIGVHQGRGFGIETKRPGKTLTARQELTKGMMEKAGATVFVIGEGVISVPGDPDKKPNFTGMEALEGWLLLGR
jgi:hypothetical protein